YVGKGNEKSSAPPADLTHATVDELIAALGHQNLVVRTHATHQLVHRIGNSAVTAVNATLNGSSNPEQRAHSLWVLFRLNALDAATIARLSNDQSRLVRVHLVK